MWFPVFLGHGRVGCIIQDHMGTLLGGSCTFLLRSSPEEVETEAILVGMPLARENQLHNIIVESDCKCVVDKLNNGVVSHWRIYPLI